LRERIWPLERLWLRYWALSWRWKGSLLATPAVILIAVATMQGSGEEPKPADDPASTTAQSGAVVTESIADASDPIATPTAATAVASRTLGFGSGLRRVGLETTPGRYRATDTTNACAWSRLSGLGGTAQEILASDLPGQSDSVVVDVLASDVGFVSAGCGDWSADLAPVTRARYAPFSNGTFIVGSDITPGDWTTSGRSGCHWQRLAGFWHCRRDDRPD
jgi:hypothetical protein